MSGLLNYLDKVRARPEAERRRLLWVWTITLTLIIVLIWLLNLYVTDSWRFGNGGSGAATTTASTSWWQESRQTWYSIETGIKEGWAVISDR